MKAIPTRVRRRIGITAAAVLVTVAAIVPAGESWAQETLLSQNRPTTASSNEDGALTPDRAVDGAPDTRWASAEGADPQWISVDLGRTATVSRVVLSWEAAYATAYQIQVSPDARTWSPVYQTSTGNGEKDELHGLNAAARHVRVYGTRRGTAYGYSLWELQVYGSTGAADAQPPSTPGNLRITGTTASTATLAWAASTDNTGVVGYQVLRDGGVVATATGTAHTDTGLSAATSYTYTVRALDAAGNVSAPAGPVNATTAPPDASFTAVAAGDIAEECGTDDDECAHPRTAALARSINPQFVVTMGDNQYDDGTIEQFRANYDKTWGTLKSRTRPSPGNHESYDSSGYLAGYRAYFGSAAFPAGKPYYSYDVGNWHFIALDSNTFDESAQLDWLARDLAATSRGCLAAYWHHPLFSSGEHGNQPVARPVWDLLLRHRADLVLNGHDHHYERFGRQNAAGRADPNGIVEVIGGTGGASPYEIDNVQPNSEKRITHEYGVLKLTFTDDTFAWRYLDVDGKTLDASPTHTCDRG
ncbi:discoidin domain-containing protein [Actinoplanes sp. NPDC051346]|uniref:discoidin domain-containing protein n=1 Tax=Actinoplanes sp. NPDC051346 TaxID=3155048 RepID=UPI003434F523